MLFCHRSIRRHKKIIVTLLLITSILDMIKWLFPCVALLGISILILLILLISYDLFRIFRARKRLIICDLRCGDISDLLIFMDAILTDPYILLRTGISFKKLSKQLDKLENLFPKQAFELRNILEVLKTQPKGTLRKGLLISVTGFLILVSMLIYAFESPTKSQSHTIFMLLVIVGACLMVIGLLYWAKGRKDIIESIFDIPDDRFITIRDFIIKFIATIAQNLSEPLALPLIAVYPGTKREGDYVLILPNDKQLDDSGV